MVGERQVRVFTDKERLTWLDDESKFSTKSGYQPISENFKQLVSNPPSGINHIAFTVTDIEMAVELMGKKGVRPGHVTPDAILDMPKSRVAYFNKDDTAGILIEFVEPRADVKPPVS